MRSASSTPRPGSVGLTPPAESSLRFSTRWRLAGVALALVAVAAVVAVRRRLPLRWQLLVVVCITPSMLFGVVGLGRYAAECFPVAIAIAILVSTAPRWMRASYFAASAVSLVVMAILVRHGRLTP